ncbi:MAG: tripartite tricarboxylate transporter TctB family protein [Rhodocyclaceae bacterium]
MTFNISQSPRDFWLGVLYLVIGGSAVFIAGDYELGTLLRMGPGYVPKMLGYALCVMGAIALVRAFARRGSPIEPFAWKAIALILGAIVLFGVLARGAGLVPAVIALVAISALASPRAERLTTTLLALGSAFAAWLIFVKGLGIPLQALGSWFGY